MEIISHFWNWLGTFFNRIRTATITIYRRVFHRIRILERTKKVCPISLPENVLINGTPRSNTRPDIVLSIDEIDEPARQFIPDRSLSASSTFLEDLTEFLKLPFDVRLSIYKYLSSQDIFTLRLTNSLFKHDISNLHGLKITLKDFRPGYNWIRGTGIASLTIENFTESVAILKSPFLLTELIIKGRISKQNLQYLLHSCFNLENLEIEFDSNVHADPELFLTGDLRFPDNLRRMRIISPISFSPYSIAICQNVKATLSKIPCSHIQSFSFEVILLVEPGGTELVNHYHSTALNFIHSHSSSLKDINIDIKRLTFGPSTPVRQLSEGDMQNIPWMDKLQLTNFRLAIDRYLEDWMPILKSQRNLKTIELFVEGLDWSNIIPTIGSHCGNTLKTLSVVNISLPDGGESRRLNLDVLHDYITLEKLTLRHQEHPDLQTPRVSNSGQLPQNLRELCLAYFVLKPYQELQFLLKLPNLRKLELEYWSENEYSLASFLTTLAFLIKLDMTDVDYFTLTGSKRKFENRNAEIKKLTDVNVKTVHVFREEYDDFETKLIIKRHSHS